MKYSIQNTLALYREKNNLQAIYQFLATFSMLILMVIIAIKSFENSWFYAWGGSVILTGFCLVRLFIIQHDCSHRSFFESKEINDFIGRLCSVFTLTPFSFWRAEHTRHHASHGNLDERGISDVWLMTKFEYSNASLRKRFFYRVYRNSLVLLLLGPFFVFIVKRRFPTGLAAKNSTLLKSVVSLNIFAFFLYYQIYAVFGAEIILYVVLPAIFLASSIGVFIFVIQHNHENSYWENSKNWSFEAASLDGSTVLRFGAIFDLLTANIAYHSIHHLNPSIPSYRLKEAYFAVKNEIPNTELSFFDAIRSLKWKLWDEDRKKMVGFGQI